MKFDRCFLMYSHNRQPMPPAACDLALQWAEPTSSFSPSPMTTTPSIFTMGTEVFITHMGLVKHLLGASSMPSYLACHVWFRRSSIRRLLFLKAREKSLTCIENLPHHIHCSLVCCIFISLAIASRVRRCTIHASRSRNHQNILYWQAGNKQWRRLCIEALQIYTMADCDKVEWQAYLALW